MSEEKVGDYLPHLKISLLDGLRIFFPANEAKVISALSLPPEQLNTPGEGLKQLCKDKNCPLPYSSLSKEETGFTLGGPMTAKEISEVLDMAPSLVSRELNKLRIKGIIEVRPRKGTISRPPNEYYIEDKIFIALLKLLLQIQDKAIVIT